jgi:hypothetical protein
MFADGGILMAGFIFCKIIDDLRKINMNMLAQNLQYVTLRNILSEM